MKIGIIGCGDICSVYVENIKGLYESVNIEAVADLDMKKAKEIAKVHNIPYALEVMDMLRRDDIGMIVNLTPPKAHYKVNKSIIKAGKHVYSEKPLALDNCKVNELIKLADEKKVKIGCSPDTFLGAGMQTGIKMVEQGWIGKPHSFTFNMVSTGPELWHPTAFHYESGVGTMMDIGPYGITALVSLFGPVKKVVSSKIKPFEQKKMYHSNNRNTNVKVEENTTYFGILEFESGVTGNFTVSYDIYYSKLPIFEIYGTEGTLILPDPNFMGGEIKVARKEQIIEKIEGEIYNGGNDDDVKNIVGQEIEPYKVPQLYGQPLKFSRGLGIFEMIYAIENDKEHRANEELCAHVTEVLLAMVNGRNLEMIEIKSKCKKPETLPEPAIFENWSV